MRSMYPSFGAAFVVIVALFASEAQAQQKMPSYQPARPALSPYLYLTRPQVGYFPNYQTFVEPYRIQERTNQIQQTQITGIKQQVQKQQTMLQNQPATVAPTGTASVYGNHSHYYSSSPSRGRSSPGRR